MSKNYILTKKTEVHGGFVNPEESFQEVNNFFFFLWGWGIMKKWYKCTEIVIK